MRRLETKDMASDTQTSDIDGFSFEEALRELEGIVKRLESGDSPLEQAIEDYARGTALKNHCRKKLEDARLRVEKLTEMPDGSLAAAPFGQE